MVLIGGVLIELLRQKSMIFTWYVIDAVLSLIMMRAMGDHAGYQIYTNMICPCLNCMFSGDERIFWR